MPAADTSDLRERFLVAGATALFAVYDRVTGVKARAKHYSWISELLTHPNTDLSGRILEAALPLLREEANENPELVRQEQPEEQDDEAGTDVPTADEESKADIPLSAPTGLLRPYTPPAVSIVTGSTPGTSCLAGFFRSRLQSRGERSRS